MKTIFALGVSLCLSQNAFAATRNVTLKVPGMTCPTCPITLKKVLGRVAGVQSISINYAQKEVVVQFDDTRTTEAALLNATAQIGFPAQISTTPK